MNYQDISNKWKSFLTENTFKEDKLIPKKKKKLKKKKLLQGEEKEEQLDEFSGAGAVVGAPENITDKPNKR